jgi:hypothetical protein
VLFLDRKMMALMGSAASRCLDYMVESSVLHRAAAVAEGSLAVFMGKERDSRWTIGGQ